MRIVFLGTGTSQGIPVIGCKCDVCKSPNTQNHRLRSSVYIETDEGKKLLIDTGPDLRQQLLRHGIDDLDAILYTHEHNDHIAGLDDIRPINFLHQKTIPAYGLQRVLDDIKIRFHYAFDHQPYPGSPKIELEVITSQEWIFNQVQCIEVNHGTIDILGFRIGNFAYLTDIKYIKEAELFKLENLEVVVISALQKKSHHSHQSLAEAVELALKINAGKTFFTHVSHTMGLVESWSKELPDNIYCAWDGLELKI